MTSIMASKSWKTQRSIGLIDLKDFQKLWHFIRTKGPQKFSFRLMESSNLIIWILPNLIVPWLMTQLVPKFPWDGAQAVLSQITCFTAYVTSGSERCNQRIIVMNWSNTDMDSGYHPVLLLNKHRPTHKLTIDRLYHQSIYLIMELYEERIGSQQKTCYFWHF